MKKSKDWIDHWFDHGIDVPNRTVFLQGGVDADMLDRATAALQLFELEDKPILILLSTYGGCEINGMGIYDLIRGCKGHVTIRVVGEACSMGAVILQAADHRELLPNAVVMHHLGGVEFPYTHKKNVKLSMKFMEKYDARLDQIMLDRVNEKRSKEGLDPLTLTWWQKQDLWDNWLLPEDTIKLGLADEIYRGDQ